MIILFVASSSHHACRYFSCVLVLVSSCTLVIVSVSALRVYHCDCCMIGCLKDSSQNPLLHQSSKKPLLPIYLVAEFKVYIWGLIKCSSSFKKHSYYLGQPSGFSFYFSFCLFTNRVSFLFIKWFYFYSSKGPSLFLFIGVCF